MQIRYYKESDYELIKSWWNEDNKECPPKNMFSVDSSFIAEINGEPALSLTLYLTNCKGICFLETFVGNPKFKGSKRKEASKNLVTFIYEFARVNGFKTILGFAINEKLEEYYQELGLSPVRKNITSMMRKL